MNDENQPAGSPTATPEFANAKQSKLSSTDRKTIQPSEDFVKSIGDPAAINPAATAQAPATGLSMPDLSALSADPVVQSQPEPSPVAEPPVPVAAPTPIDPPTPLAPPVAPPISEPAILPTREDHGEATIQPPPASADAALPKIEPLQHEPAHGLDNAIDSANSGSAATVSTIAELTPAAASQAPVSQTNPTNGPQAPPAKPPSFVSKLLNMFKRK